MMSIYKTISFALLVSVICSCQDKGGRNVLSDSTTTLAKQPMADAVTAVPDTNKTAFNRNSRELPVAVLRDEQVYKTLLNGIAQWNYQHGDTLQNYKSSYYYSKVLLPHLPVFLKDGDLSKVYKSGLDMDFNHKKSAKSAVTDEDCPDSISLLYDEEMQVYFLQIEESYWVEEEGGTTCYGSDRIIHFKISGNEIEVVTITVAG